MKIVYIFRPKRSAFSIEKVFETIINSVRNNTNNNVSISKLKPFKIWPLGMLYYIIKFCIISYCNKSCIYHITGDVHYIASFMNPHRTVLTIHDLASLKNPNTPWYSRILCYWMWYYVPLKRLKYITCISNKTKQELLEAFPWIKASITVIPNPVDDSFNYSFKSFNTQKPTILHIGTNSNKNLGRVISSIDGIKSHLRIVGALSDDIIELLHKHNIDYTNVSNLTDEEIIEEYKKADIVSFPSLYEGFGMPILEGQAIGRAVLTSNIEPTCSISGGGACLINPQSIDEIRNGFFYIINDPKYRENLIHIGLRNIAFYRSDKIATEYFNLYKTIML